jgi:putative hydrolase of the HAD superfamily
MLNALYENVNWNEVQNVGFDLDGTLYDEFDFIKQVYEEISKKSCRPIKNFMLDKWLEKGSSYPYIFKETYEHFADDFGSIELQTFVGESLELFRNFNPKLKLSKRTEHLLVYFKSRYNLFLVSDGNFKLQKRKFDSLRLEKYFDKSNVIFTSELGLKKSELNSDNVLEDFVAQKTVFLGDRKIDEDFATKSGYTFIKVYNMLKVQE